MASLTDSTLHLLTLIGLRPLPPSAIPVADLAGILFTAAISYRATEPPHIATDEERSKAQGSDVINRLGLTKLKIIRYLPHLWVAKRLLEKGWATTENADTIRGVFWLGNIVTCVGAVGRLLCHDALGKFFTFDLAVKKDHKVIDKGPYGIVRHPAYTSTLLMIFGMSCSIFFGSPGFSPGARKTVGVAGAAWAIILSYLLNRRIAEEEAMLKREIGQEYISYMSRVRYRLVPAWLILDAQHSPAFNSSTMPTFTSEVQFDIALMVAVELLSFYTYAKRRIAPDEAAAKAGGNDFLVNIGAVRSGFQNQLSNWFIRSTAKAWTLYGLIVYGWTLQSAQEKQWVRFALHAGCAISFIGFCGRLVCFKTLGKYFTFNLAIQEGQKVIRAGPYGYIRHPGYLTGFLTYVGRTIVGYFGNPSVTSTWRPLAWLVGIAEFAMWIAFMLRRIKDEEAMLKRELEKDYAQYMKDVPYRLLPGIW